MLQDVHAALNTPLERSHYTHDARARLRPLSPAPAPPPAQLSFPRPRRARPDTAPHLVVEDGGERLEPHGDRLPGRHPVVQHTLPDRLRGAQQGLQEVTPLLRSVAHAVVEEQVLGLGGGGGASTFRAGCFFWAGGWETNYTPSEG